MHRYMLPTVGGQATNTDVQFMIRVVGAMEVNITLAIFALLPF